MWGLSIPSLFLLLTLPLGTAIMATQHRKVKLIVLPPKVVPESDKQLGEERLPPPYICNHYNLKRKKC